MPCRGSMREVRRSAGAKRERGVVDGAARSRSRPPDDTLRRWVAPRDRIFRMAKYWAEPLDVNRHRDHFKAGSAVRRQAPLRGPAFSYFVEAAGFR
jgi:hypothetical protein